MSGEIVKSWNGIIYNNNDEMLTDMCKRVSMGGIVNMAEKCLKTRDYVMSRMICNAVFETDIELIQTIVSRIDGTIQPEGERESYSTSFGDALDEVLDLDRARALEVTPEDKPIIAMAKAVVFVATDRTFGNQAKKKERNLAAKMILERTGGRKLGPTQLQVETVYVQPDWMGLPEGGEQSEHRDEDGADRAE